MGGGGKAPAPAQQRTPPCTPQPCLQRPPPHTRTHMRVGEGGRRFSGVVHQHRALAVGDDIGADCAGGWGGAWGVGEGGDARRSLRVRGRSGARCLCVATTQPPPLPAACAPRHSLLDPPPPPPPHTHTHAHPLSPLPRKNSCSRVLSWRASTATAAPSSSALRQITLPIESVSTSYCVQCRHGSWGGEGGGRFKGRRCGVMHQPASSHPRSPTHTQRPPSPHQLTHPTRPPINPPTLTTCTTGGGATSPMCTSARRSMNPSAARSSCS